MHKAICTTFKSTTDGSLSHCVVAAPRSFLSPHLPPAVGAWPSAWGLIQFQNPFLKICQLGPPLVPTLSARTPPRKQSQTSDSVSSLFWEVIPGIGEREIGKEEKAMQGQRGSSCQVSARSLRTRGLTHHFLSPTGQGFAPRSSPSCIVESTLQHPISQHPATLGQKAKAQSTAEVRAAGYIWAKLEAAAMAKLKDALKDRKQHARGREL